MAQATHPQSIKFGDNNTNCGNTIRRYNKTVYKSDENVHIMRWLSPLEPSNRHQGVRTGRCGGIGDWLLGTSEFQGWRGSPGGADKAVLFCSGNPGVGKTYLSSLVIDSLCDQAREEDITVACLYCDFLAQQEQTIANVIGAILKQLVDRGNIPIYLREAFQEGQKEIGGRGLQLVDLMRMLKLTIASSAQVFICIDALDEFPPKHLPEFLELLRDIVGESPRTRIFLTGRPFVRENIRRYFPRVLVIPVKSNTGDIRNYLEMRLDRDLYPEAMSDSLRADIMRMMKENIFDTFLLAALNIDAILGEVTIRQRKRKLEEMAEGNGLSEAYTATISRVKAQKGNKSALGMRVLAWVFYSERPLRAEELCHAFGVEIGSTELDPENIPELRTLLASCLGLVTLEASSSIVRVVHRTLYLYLFSNPTVFHSPHSTIAEVCLTYLNFGSVWDLSPALDSAPSSFPLLEYSSLYWAEHAREGMTENVKMLALRLLDRFDEHISSRLLSLHYNESSPTGPYFVEARIPTGFTLLHGVAYLGIVEIFAGVLEMKEWDVNATDSAGNTALAWAASKGYEEIVKMLLERDDANPDHAETEHGRTPLSWAAYSGHEGIVKMLLEREDVNPDHPDPRFGQTPLTFAAQKGHEEVVKMLLRREDVTPDLVDTLHGQTPLSCAAENGHEGVVKILLERKDVNSSLPDTEYGRTPLTWAAQNGHVGVVGILIERPDVIIDTLDKTNQTPLSLASSEGHDEVVKILQDKSHAAGRGH